MRSPRVCVARSRSPLVASKKSHLSLAVSARSSDCPGLPPRNIVQRAARTQPHSTPPASAATTDLGGRRAVQPAHPDSRTRLLAIADGNGLRGPHVRGVPGVCRTWKEADDDRDAHRRPRHNRNDSIPAFRRLSHLKSPDAATTVAGTPSRSLAISSVFFSHISFERRSHDHCSLLPRTPGPRLDRGEFARSPYGKHTKAADASTAASPASPREDSPLLGPMRRTGSTDATRAAPATGSPP